MCRDKLSALLLFLVLGLSSFQSFSLSSDKNSTVHITADQSTYNYKTGVNTFEGNVKVDQGTTHLTSDRLITHNNSQHKIEVAIATSLASTSHYWTTPKAGETEMHAYAKIIRFYPQVSNVTLEQSVTLKQGENSFQGELIHYNNRDQTVTVPGMKTNRAVIIYKPDK
jgi:lipopolysaccharide export system protein LptA